jgi:hypothetical protein
MPLPRQDRDASWSRSSSPGCGPVSPSQRLFYRRSRRFPRTGAGLEHFCGSQSAQSGFGKRDPASVRYGPFQIYPFLVDLATVCLHLQVCKYISHYEGIDSGTLLWKTSSKYSIPLFCVFACGYTIATSNHACRVFRHTPTTSFVYTLWISRTHAVTTKLL